MKRTWKILLTAVVVQGLAACAQQGGAAGGPGGNADTSILTAYHWRLQQALNATGAPQPDAVNTHGGQALQLTFAGERVAVAGLCNTLGGGYRVDGARMAITQMVGTLRMCPDQALMKYERDVAERLPTVSGWEISGGTARPDAGAQPALKLTFADGSQWRLAGTPTDQTRYGSAGETMFLEVAPDLVPCSHPLIPNMKCMRVRTVSYDGAGIKQGYGDWEAFYGNIQGYTHTAGVRNVLRIKRYTVANPPADASRYAYVLDMTVESEQVSGR
ncbi:META and DUF4377 domain-containing protein [Pigmentiphaga sp. YJ18]|uniref:META and DUF4377 domain-containing protein n=1 Tax=Pigmentiphaga sp. YJ18 TaxID=3134907 RepID=UPI0031153E6A